MANDEKNTENEEEGADGRWTDTSLIQQAAGKLPYRPRSKPVPKPFDPDAGEVE